MQILVTLPGEEIQARVGNGRKFFRVRAANMRTAVGLMRIEIINARQAHALRYLRQKHGLRLAVNNEPAAA